MSKHYKAEDVICTLADQWRFEQEMTSPYPPEDIEEWKKLARALYADLPTIEVSEDCISRHYMLRALNGYGKDWQEDCEIADVIRNAPSVVPQVPSEDCISREYLKSFEYINKGDFNSVETIREWIDNAPSVVPTTEQSSMVGEWIDNHNGTYTCSECGNKHSKANFCCECGAKMKG